MRVIEFKAKDSKEFKRFVDIGYSDKYFESMNVYLKSENYAEYEIRNGYLAWLKKIENESIGAQLIVIHFYVSEFQKEYFKDVYGEILFNILIDNHITIVNFVKKWFWSEEVPIFKGLDFTNDEDEREIFHSCTNENGTYSQILFLDGSIIKFLDEDDSIKSLYVGEEKFYNLKEEINYILSLFKMFN